MSSQPQKLFDDISAFVAESRQLLSRNQLLELDGLDHNVRQLCEMVLKLSQEERLRHAEQLQRLLKELSSLGEALVERRDALSAELLATADHRKANVAYRTSDNMDKKDH